MSRLIADRAVFGVVCCAALLPGAVLASEPLIDNLSEPTRAYTEIVVDAGGNLWAAQAFAADSRTWTLDSIEAILGNNVGSTDVIARLHSGKDPLGPAIADLIVPPLLAKGTEVVTLTPATPVTLVPGETYWLVMGLGADGMYEWAYARGDAFTGPGSFGSYGYSYDLGMTWLDFGAENPYQLRVNVTLQPACAADCNEDALLDIQDFSCFQNAYALGDMAKADVGGVSGCTPDGALTISDFSCFQNLFALGCP